ncbi:cytochrome P450 [Candidatus Berkiella aquae]|uniref:Cytochrome P450 n=1 Tax=Candidatus Berkiella aquae TaxID=295108 RepID=A0A0Q9YTL7_9GAMM|nr:cytochrome P450 [Candidatus Berkiella aquae]MCS5711270.1 cytochrome P450 [Candidatus Berkiella aquae]
MLTGPKQLLSSMIQTVLNPLRKIGTGLTYYMGDSGKIIRDGEKFMFTELADRAVASQQGHSSTYLGLPFLSLYHFHIFTGENFVKEAVSYGEYSEKFPGKFDAKARSLFDPVKEFLGDPAIVNMNGKEVKAERFGIKNNLSQARAVSAAANVFDRMLSNWAEEKSLNHIICYACTQIIAKAWYNLDEVPEELIPLLKTAEYYVFNRDKVSDQDFENLRQQIKDLNDRVISEQEENIRKGESYLTYLQEARGKKRLADLNALAGLVVEGNITTVVTGALLQIATNQELQNRLREEIKSINFDIGSPEGYQKLKELPLLHQVYLETLRYYSPSPPMARYASKAGTINGVHIPARSYLFIPLRRVMHDPKQWSHPEIFDPSRHEAGSRRLNEFPLTPFSTGPRVCPASFGFAEAMFKIAIAKIIMNNELTLTSHADIETIPVETKEPRFKQTYFVKLNNLAQKAESQAEVDLTPTQVLRMRGATSYSPNTSSSSTLENNTKIGPTQQQKQAYRV